MDEGVGGPVGAVCGVVEEMGFVVDLAACEEERS